MNETNHRIQNIELAQSAAYAEDRLRGLASLAITSGAQLAYEKILPQDPILQIDHELTASDPDHVPEVGEYSDVLESISADPEEYARAVKKLRADKPLTGSELRMGIRGLIGAGNFPKTDTSNKEVIVKKHDNVITINLGNGLVGQAIQPGEETAVRRDDDSILIGELPFNATGRSLDEITEDYLAANIGHHTKTPLNFTVEQEDLLKRAGSAIDRIRANSVHQRHDFEKQNDWLTRHQTDDGRVQPLSTQELSEAKQTRSAIAVADIKDIYLQLDAELAVGGVTL